MHVCVCALYLRGWHTFYPFRIHKLLFREADIQRTHGREGRGDMEAVIIPLEITGRKIPFARRSLSRHDASKRLLETFSSGESGSWEKKLSKILFYSISWPTVRPSFFFSSFLFLLFRLPPLKLSRRKVAFT